jgi:hypothetical protein
VEVGGPAGGDTDIAGAAMAVSQSIAPAQIDRTAMPVFDTSDSPKTFMAGLLVSAPFASSAE